MTFKTSTAIVAFATVLFENCSDTRETPQTILNRVKENYDRYSSIAYKINYRTKLFSGDDTLQWNAHCKLIRDTTDTLFGGYIWFLTADGIEKYYDLNNSYEIDHSKKTIKVYENTAKGSAITGNMSADVIRVNFIRTGKLLADLKDTVNKATLSSNGNHFIVSIQYADDVDFSEMERKISITKENFIIDKISYKVKFQGNYQYDEWNLSDIEFDKADIAYLNQLIGTYHQSYTSEQYSPPDEEDYATLTVGKQAPSFKGTNFQNGEEMSLNDYTGKFIVLDFSYITCMPCIKAIPHLIQIQNEFRNKNVVVLAINSKDNDEKSKKRLPEFISKNFVNYPFILTTYKTDSVYNVKVYPTIYAIDRKGQIVYSQIGFYNHLVDTLKTIIHKNLM